jgi:serine phosphatase RsbU (regulator of sigma subunit)
MRSIFVAGFLFFSSVSFSITELDSLFLELNKTMHDTVRFEVLMEISEELLGEGDYEKAIAYGQEALDLSKLISISPQTKLFGILAEIDANRQIGFCLEKTDQFPDALNYFHAALSLAVKNNLFDKQCAIFGNLGMYSYTIGDYPMALDYSLRQLQLAKKLNNRLRMASAYNKIGITYKRQMMHDEALENLFLSRDIYLELDEKELAANGMNNIGNVYFNMKNYHLAYAYYLDEFKIGIEIEEPELIGDSWNCMALIFNEVALYPQDTIYHWFYPNLEKSETRPVINMLDSAEHYFQQAIVVYDSLHRLYELADCYNGLGQTYLLQGENQKAIQTYLKAYELAMSNGILEKEMKASYGLFVGYRNLSDFESSLYWNENYHALKDSVFSDDNSREMGRLQSRHEFEVKEAALLVEQNHERELSKAEKRTQQIILMIVCIGLLLVILLLFFLFNRFRLTQKQKKTIELHKAEVETKQKEILDSITYAKRLQHAILAREESIKSVFPDSFLLYKPKDIVAGDFYFFETTDTHVFYAAADCTGHGVPGAMVSIVCSNALTRSIKEFGITEPGKILDKTRDLVVETFEKSGTDVKDGMDISLISKNKLTGELKWAGAHNPLWIIESNQVREIKPDKQPIGKAENSKPFTTHLLQDCANAILILLTDGYADQFGGEKGKKFKASRLKELLLQYSGQPMQKQKQEINHAFEIWRGNLEQIDDVCVIGVRV